MKLLASPLAALLLAASAPARAQTLPPIERNKVGIVEIGASAYTIYDTLTSDHVSLFDLRLEGNLSPALEISLTGSTMRKGLIAELAPWDGLTVFRIQIHDPAFRTKQGVGVGSTLGDVRAAWKLGGVGFGEGGFFVFVPEFSASFELDQSGLDPRTLPSLRTAETLPDSVRVVSILLTG